MSTTPVVSNDNINDSSSDTEFLDTLKSMYQDFECSVEVHKEYTPWFNVNSGVNQGCLLSPTLFSIFVNDLLKDYEACGSEARSTISSA